ncbi:Putative ThuR, regulatory protein for trehalosemaltose transport [Cronobacter sakazakii 696]|nr:Putative ThuR, regulatory protein for trehalosemaltose transport [Cronobacter sakazakii 696]
MSLKAIAAQLGLSVTTVSRALNGYDDVSQSRSITASLWRWWVR